MMFRVVSDIGIGADVGIDVAPGVGDSYIYDMLKEMLDAVLCGYCLGFHFRSYFDVISKCFRCCCSFDTAMITVGDLDISKDDWFVPEQFRVITNDAVPEN
ncbi:Hypothetical predicted protein [Octopus vulgaris]|uniref:Uncharacterized protein n=1 Tax=Octopus vulgaris TaxID=6645 RepID=A0AA36FMZ5_OCTVU|nr:Hypothetical predicted protein [Octopus vulgaris]